MFHWRKETIPKKINHKMQVMISAEDQLLLLRLRIWPNFIELTLKHNHLITSQCSKKLIETSWKEPNNKNKKLTIQLIRKIQTGNKRLKEKWICYHKFFLQNPTIMSREGKKYAQIMKEPLNN